MEELYFTFELIRKIFFVVFLLLLAAIAVIMFILKSHDNEHRNLFKILLVLLKCSTVILLAMVVGKSITGWILWNL